MSVKFVGSYSPSVNGYDLAKDPRCLYGWDCPRTTFHHVCDRPYRHRGRCMVKGPPPRFPCESARRPKNWDDKLRAECNS